MKTIKELQKEIHKTATEKGFWDHMDSVLEKMKSIQYIKNNPENVENAFTDEEIKAVEKAFISQKMMLMVSEIGEAMESDRKGDWMIKGCNGNDFSTEQFKDLIKDSVEDEMADVIIRIFDFAEKFGIDIQWNIEQKMKYNSQREKMHGKNY